MYLGAYADEKAAARVYDRSQIVCLKPAVDDPERRRAFQDRINFPVEVRVDPSSPPTTSRDVSYR